jgi:Tfp pilus assembly protein PilZ
VVHQKESEEFTHLLTLWIEINEKIQQYTKHRQQIENRINQSLQLYSVVQDERRIHLRIPCKIPATVRMLDQAKEVHGMVSDISMGGLFFKTPTLILVGEDLEITIQARKQKPFTLPAKVTWRKTSYPKGIGIYFKSKEVSNENLLLNLIIYILRELYKKTGSLQLI